MGTVSVPKAQRLARTGFAARWRAWRVSMTARGMVKNIIIYLLLIVAAFVIMIPFAWMLSTSLKTSKQIFTWPIEWIPRPFVWRNYPEALGARPFLQWTRNTFLVAGLSVLGHLFSASVVGYSFSRLRWRGRDLLFMVMLSTMMLPMQVALIPKFLIFKNLGWVNTFLPLFLPTFFGGSGFNIFLMRQFMMTLPTELDDAAKLDGCGYFSILTRVILPQSFPALGFVAINTFKARWNNFMRPLIYLNNPALYTLPVGLRTFRQEFSVDWSYLMAASVMTMLPLLIVFFFGQRYFIQGVVFTGVEK